MKQQTVELHVNPSDETIRLGPDSLEILRTDCGGPDYAECFSVPVPVVEPVDGTARNA